MYFLEMKIRLFCRNGNMSTNCCRVTFCWLLESVRFFYFRGVAFRGRKSLDFYICGKSLFLNLRSENLGLVRNVFVYRKGFRAQHVKNEKD